VGQVALAARAARVVVALAALLARRDEKPLGTSVVVRRPVTFNLLYPKPFERVRPRGREVLRLQTPAGTPAPQSFTVTPLRLAPYRGDVGAVLTIMSASLIAQMSRTMPGFVWRGDGRVNYNRQPGYEVLFQAKIGGKTTYGRRTMLVPGGDTPPREGVDITMMATRSGAIPRVDAVASVNGPLKTAIRSFRFGIAPP
jgi:hypothetical protein